ncbi:MAG: MotA/TolQ/ExbB proton channel family protein [Cellvibrionaceae bacterium]
MSNEIKSLSNTPTSEPGTILPPTTTGVESIPASPSESIPVDSTSATSIFDTQQLQGLFEAGGPVIMILVAMSVIALSVFLLKYWQFLRLGINKQKGLSQALQLWRKQNTQAALETLSTLRNPIARVLEHAINLKSQTTISDAIAREEVTRIAKRELASSRSYLKVLEVIATLSPLLGLLGTVLGMITAFQKLQGAGSTVDPALLSGGIWEALLTTAAGLVVAIPTVIGLNWLEQRVERFKLTMEDAMTQAFTAPAIVEGQSFNKKRNQEPVTTSINQQQTSVPRAERKNNSTAVAFST